MAAEEAWEGVLESFLCPRCCAGCCECRPASGVLPLRGSQWVVNMYLIHSFLGHQGMGERENGAGSRAAGLRWLYNKKEPAWISH